MKNPKLTVSTVLSIVLGVWELISPSAELIFGMGTKGLAIAAVVVTVVSYVYNRISPEESLFGKLSRSIGGGGVKKP